MLCCDMVLYFVIWYVILWYGIAWYDTLLYCMVYLNVVRSICMPILSYQQSQGRLEHQQNFSCIPTHAQNTHLHTRTRTPTHCNAFLFLFSSRQYMLSLTSHKLVRETGSVLSLFWSAALLKSMSAKTLILI